MDLTVRMKDIENESDANAILAQGWPAAIAAVISISWIALFIFGVQEMGLPWVSVLFLSFGVGPVPYLCLENWFMRRRLEAVAVLLKAAQNGR